MSQRSGLTLAALRARARAIGFDAIGITSTEVPPNWGEGLATWLAEGRQGEMGWMAETRERRANPRTLWSEARSVIMLAVNYGPDEDPLGVTHERDKGAISVYARHRDYHDVIKGRLKMLGSWMATQAPGIELKVFVDTAPVMEKPLAAAAGLGWQGKHTNLVSREFGSWLFLGAIFVNVDLEANAPESDHCGSCRACLDACPTGAFPAPYQLDARRCISYLTIEHPGPIPREFRAAIGNRIYGCDDCLAVCPWNKFASLGREAKLAARDDLRRPALAEFADLDDSGFRVRFAGGPIKRIGHARFLRNVMIAIGNSGDTTLLPRVRAAIEAASPLVRGAAVWALGRLAPDEARVRAGQSRETEAIVIAEWQGWADHLAE
jgi:epoxyqueuosine reductase